MPAPPPDKKEINNVSLRRPHVAGACVADAPWASTAVPPADQPHAKRLSHGGFKSGYPQLRSPSRWEQALRNLSCNGLSTE